MARVSPLFQLLTAPGVPLGVPLRGASRTLANLGPVVAPIADRAVSSPDVASALGRMGGAAGDWAAKTFSGLPDAVKRELPGLGQNLAVPAAQIGGRALFGGGAEALAGAGAMTGVGDEMWDPAVRRSAASMMMQLPGASQQTMGPAAALPGMGSAGMVPWEETQAQAMLPNEEPPPMPGMVAGLPGNEFSLADSADVAGKSGWDINGPRSKSTLTWNKPQDQSGMQVGNMVGGMTGIPGMGQAAQAAQNIASAPGQALKGATQGADDVLGSLKRSLAQASVGHDQNAFSGFRDTGTGPVQAPAPRMAPPPPVQMPPAPSSMGGVGALARLGGQSQPDRPSPTFAPPSMRPMPTGGPASAPPPTLSDQGSAASSLVRAGLGGPATPPPLPMSDEEKLNQTREAMKQALSGVRFNRPRPNPYDTPDYMWGGR